MTSDLVVIVPSRGRPDAAYELAECFKDTTTAGTAPCFAVDDDDPDAGRYSRIVHSGLGSVIHGGHRDQPATMVTALNGRAVGFANLGPGLAPFAIGFMGDDHRPRTTGWDEHYLAALRELQTGIVYGDDLFQGVNLPTQVAMTADIIRAVGHMAPPGLRHLYVDNFWRDLGQAAGCLRYLPDVIVEHMHPLAGKGVDDDGYRRVNARAVNDADAATYQAYVRDRLPGDVALVRALRAGVPA
jgi:hypothetical protein